MTTDILVPEAGESISEGLLALWLKEEGDSVEEGDPLFEFETEKATMAVPASASGVLHILVEEDARIKVGQIVGTLSEDVGSPPVTPEGKAVPAAETTQEPETAKTPGPEGALPPAPEDSPVPAHDTSSPSAPLPAEAAERLTAASVPDRAPQDRRQERVRMSLIRKSTAEHLLQARQNAAHLTTFNEIDLHKVIEIRGHYKESFEQEHGVKIGFMSFFVKACCQALKAYPIVNAQIDGEEIVYYHYHDIGIAISTDHGLLVPVIRNADDLSFADIESAIADLARRARGKTITPDELAGGTFTITNGGVFGSVLSTPIPAYPQSAILGMHAIKKRPVVVEDEIVIRPMMNVALSYDHRLIDGRDAIGFLVKVKEFIEEPDKLLLEM